MNWIACMCILGGCLAIHPGLFFIAVGLAHIISEQGINIKITRIVKNEVEE